MKILFFGLTALSVVSGANILGIWFHAGRSHHILGEKLLLELASRGHNVTMASPFPLQEQCFENYTDIHLTGIQEDQDAREKMFLHMNEDSFFSTVSATLELVRAQTEMTLGHRQMIRLYNSRVKFDVIIIDWFMNPAILYFGKLFKAPVIALASHGTTAMANTIVGNPSPASYLPLTMLPYTTNMAFHERVINAALSIYSDWIGSRNLAKNQAMIEKIYRRYMSYEEMIKTVALVFSNGHYSFEHPRPFVPNLIPIGGFHVTKPKKLPKLFQDFMDNQSNGIIYFSLGSNMKSTMLPRQKVEEILRVFSVLPYSVIWKWEDENLEGKPRNVLISKWCPQNDILAHPRLKLFISHGGLLSTIEALHYGVPLLGIPIFGDQKSNVPNAVRKGYALQIDLKDLTELGLFQALHEIMTKPKYTEMAKKHSAMLRDQPMSPMDTAVFWVEHVIRHKGGDHLRNYGVHLSWFEYYMVDVWLLAALSFVIMAFLIFVISWKGFQLISLILNSILDYTHPRPPYIIKKKEEIRRRKVKRKKRCNDQKLIFVSMRGEDL